MYAMMQMPDLPELMEQTTKHGLEKLDLMVRFISVIESKGKKTKQEFNRLKSWLVQQLKRGITPQEDINLMEGIVKYIQSDPATPQRIESMTYLFNAEFLND